MGRAFVQGATQSLDMGLHHEPACLAIQYDFTGKISEHGCAATPVVSDLVDQDLEVARKPLEGLYPAKGSIVVDLQV